MNGRRNRVKDSRRNIKTPYDKETLAWLEDKTIKNMLHGCEGDLNQLTRGQVKNLRRRGIIGGWARSFTVKGLQLWDEIKNATA